MHDYIVISFDQNLSSFPYNKANMHVICLDVCRTLRRSLACTLYWSLALELFSHVLFRDSLQRCQRRKPKNYCSPIRPSPPAPGGDQAGDEADEVHKEPAGLEYIKSIPGILKMVEFVRIFFGFKVIIYLISNYCLSRASRFIFFFLCQVGRGFTGIRVKFEVVLKGDCLD